MSIQHFPLARIRRQPHLSSARVADVGIWLIALVYNVNIKVTFLGVKFLRGETCQKVKYVLKLPIHLCVEMM